MFSGGATYGYAAFKAHVASALEGSFGQSVKPGKKAIKVEASGGRRNADVVVAIQHRRYHGFSAGTGGQYDLGISFFTNTGERIVNYPRQHSQNCTARHQATNMWFKPMVRILKNLRSKLVDNGQLDVGIAPSYFLEGLLYNVPPEKFGGSYGDAIVASFNWIINADRSKFKCANEQYYLLRNSAETWPAVDCDRFLEALKQMWKA